MSTNWPPEAEYPSWPPAELNTTWLSFSSVEMMVRELQPLGWSRQTPTTAENIAYFQGVLCDEGHTCIGTMIVSPTGVRYPFGICTNLTHRTALVLWVVGYIPGTSTPSYDLGFRSGVT